MTSEINDLQILRALNSRFIHNFVTNDVKGHDDIIHPRFRTVTSTGGHMDRAAYLEEWASGFDPKVIPYWDMRDEMITIHGDVALVTAKTKYSLVHNNVESIGMTCYTDTYVRVGDAWLCILAQLTPVSLENYPIDDTIVVRYIKGELQPSSLAHGT